jgi:hypothetical protein
MTKGSGRNNLKQKNFFGKHIQAENEGINIKKIIEETRKQYEPSAAANLGRVGNVTTRPSDQTWKSQQKADNSRGGPNAGITENSNFSEKNSIVKSPNSPNSISIKKTPVFTFMN